MIRDEQSLKSVSLILEFCALVVVIAYFLCFFLGGGNPKLQDLYKYKVVGCDMVS